LNTFIFSTNTVNAASVASMLLTTECVLADEAEENPVGAGAPPMGGGMGGMM